MKNLDKDWLTEGWIDFEYKKYVLLAYLNEVKKSFKKIELYPYFSDLVFHYQNIMSVKENKKLVQEHFPKNIASADLEKLEIQYQKIIDDDDIMSELQQIIDYSLLHFKKSFNEGKSIYDFIEEHIDIEPVGLLPLQKDEGYFFIVENEKKETKIYEYKISLFESATEKFRGIHIVYLDSIRKSLGTTFENIKINIVKKYKKLPNPATYIINAKIKCPFEETLLPISKRMLVKYLSKAA